MKKLISYAAALAMALGVNAALPSTAYADSAQDALEICREVLQEEEGTLGVCMQLRRANDVVSQCKLWALIAEQTGLPFLFPFNNHGQCVKNGGPFG